MDHGGDDEVSKIVGIGNCCIPVGVDQLLNVDIDGCIVFFLSDVALFKHEGETVLSTVYASVIPAVGELTVCVEDLVCIVPKLIRIEPEHQSIFGGHLGKGGQARCFLKGKFTYALVEVCGGG